MLSQSPILPTPVSYEVYDAIGAFYGKVDVEFGKIPKNIQDYFTQQLATQFHTTVSIPTDPSQVKIRFEKIKHQKADYYKIESLENTVIYYSSDASCFYAINSYLQLIEKHSEDFKDERVTMVYPAFKMEDYPRFQWRGLHLDVSRHFYSVEEVKHYIDLMALYKYNVFHWHLTDDQGWRIEIKKYPKLTEIGAWRDSTVNDHYSTTPRTYTKARYGGFYTQQQIREIVQYAADRYITVVPEIEMPGHSRAALAAYPEYSCTGKQQEVPGLWGVFEDIYCAKPESIHFLQDILSEVLTLFPSPYIHIGGDEAPKERWHACPKCQEVIRSNKLKDEHELQSYFIRQMDDYLTKNGRKLIGWDEILEGGLSPNATVMSWRGIEGGIEAAKQGHDVVMSPGSHCYFDHYQSDFAGEPLAIGGYTPLQKVYSYDPVPEQLSASQQKHILGAQANLWTEYIPNMKQLEYMTYPRAIALAQALWCERKPSFEDFRQVLVESHLPRLKEQSVNFSKALFYASRSISRHPNGLLIEYTIPGLDTPIKTDIMPRAFPGQPIRTLKSTIQPTGAGDVPPTSFEYKKHAALGLPLTLNTAPNSHYNAGGDLTLVDGVIGRRPWNGREWLGFDTSHISVTLDLQESRQVNSVSISMLLDPGSWIYLPEQVVISVSDDGKNWEMVLQREIREVTGVYVNKKGRYIKIELETKTKIPEGQPGAGHHPWTFLDEVWVE